MEIGLIYSKSDPRQAQTRNFVHRFLAEHGVLAEVVEEDQPVKSPTLIINGFTLTDMRQRPRETNAQMFPAIEDVARALEEHLWCI
jgi:hypothetical protein